MHLGDYENAVTHLHEVIKKAKGNKKIDGYKAASGWAEIYIGAHRMFSLNENYLGRFSDVDQDPCLLEADAMLRNLKQDRDASIKKVEGQKSQILDIHGRMIEGSAQFQNEVSRDSTIDISQDQNLNILEQELGLTRAKVLCLQGYHRRARDVAQNLYRSLEYELGPNNILTLEAAVLSAHILVRTSKVDEGERVAGDARRRIIKSFSEHHPLAMEAIHVSITAYISQGRLLQALGTSRQLCRVAASNESFGHIEVERMRHPQTLKFYAQFSDANLTVGNYSKEEKVMREQVLEHTSFGTTEEAKLQTQTNGRPPIAKYLAHLAWAHLHRGKVSEPGDNITKALQLQLRYYAPDLATSIGLSAAEITKNVLKRWKGEGMHENKSHTSSSLVYYPDILYTFHVVSEHESRRAKPNLDLILETRDRIHQELLSLLGNDSYATIRAQLALWYYYRIDCSLGEKKSFEKALDLFQGVSSKVDKESSDTWSYLQIDNPLVLEARREAALARIVVEDMAAACMQKCLKVLQNVAVTQERTMGRSHSQALQTRMSLLAIAVALHDPVSEDIRDDLLFRLRDPEVRSEKRVESLLIEERVAHIYWRGGLFSICKEIFIELVLLVWLKWLKWRK